MVVIEFSKLYISVLWIFGLFRASVHPCLVVMLRLSLGLGTASVKAACPTGSQSAECMCSQLRLLDEGCLHGWTQCIQQGRVWVVILQFTS